MDFFLQPFPEHFKSALDAHLGPADGYANHIGDLPRNQALPVVQQQGFPVLQGEVCQGLVKPNGFGESLRVVVIESYGFEIGCMVGS